MAKKPSSYPTPSKPKSGAQAQPRRFMFSDGGSHKFWEVHVKGNDLIVNYGRIGTKGQDSTKSFADPSSALKELDKLVREKVKKGYTELKAADVYPGAQPLPKRVSKFAQYVLMDNKLAGKPSLTDEEEEAIEELMDETGDDTIAVDWREWEMDIVDYINEHLKSEITAELEETDLKLTYKGKTIEYKLPESSEGRWITVYLCEQLIKATHRVQAMKSSLENDTFVYVVKEHAWWKKLEEEIGPTEFQKAFCDPIKAIKKPQKLPKFD